MSVKITQRSDLRKHRQRVTLDGTEYRIVFTWRQRQRAWYFDIYSQSGDPISLGRRISAGWSPTRTATDERLPPGAFVVKGVDGYSRSDLGDDLQVWYYGTAEIAALPAIDDLDGFSVDVD